ncbi:MAG: hypothetical protein HC883_03560 [Bdellovibrionaceae bacterium]|nr:hypothetical protein [Pseudobdellovibrionaceae bacterium]
MDLYQFLGTRDPENIPLKAHMKALEGIVSYYPSSHDGKDFQSMMSPTYDAEGKINGCVGVAIEVTGMTPGAISETLLHQKGWPLSLVKKAEE